MPERVYDTVLAAVPDEIVRENQPLAEFTTFRIGGPADLLIKPRNERELRDVLIACREAGVPLYVLGSGSNVLVRDGGFRGAVIVISAAMSAIRVGGNTLRVMAGARLSMAARAAAENRLAGLEFAYGIPGSVGGAVYMNAGAYGSEMKDVVSSVTVLDKNGVRKTLRKEQLRFGYRSSCLQGSDDVVVEAEFLLKRDNPAGIKERMADYTQRRREKQPLDLPSAGSAFKRPEGHFAAALIDEAGLKGLAVGGAQVSPKHAGFIVNTGAATAADVLELMETVRERVLAHSRVELESEIRVIGED